MTPSSPEPKAPMHCGQRMQYVNTFARGKKVWRVFRCKQCGNIKHVLVSW